MNLSDIMLFGKAIIGDGGGSSGGSDGNMKAAMYIEGMETYYDTFAKISDSVLTPDDFYDAALWIVDANVEKDFILVGDTNCMSLEEGATAVLYKDVPYIMSITAEKAAEMGGLPAGTYAIISDVDTNEKLMTVCALIWK